jgi:hypothetical protein
MTRGSIRLLLLTFALYGSASAETYLRADGVTDTYSLIDSVFGGTGTVVEGENS